MGRAIIHLDLDAFYASVEQQRRPELRGRPVIVGGDRDHPGRSVVSAASYEARRFGVRSAMPLGQAIRLCPQGVVVPVDFSAYRPVSAQVFDIAHEYTPLVEPLSLDEAYLDVTGSLRRFGDARSIAEAIRERIHAVTGLHASFGVASCKVVAKVASDLRKPRGFVVVEPGEEAAFLAPLPLRTLPGLGPAAERALESLGVHTLGELVARPRSVIERRLGRHAGASLWERAQGIDSSVVSPPGRPKSISREETFSSDMRELEDLDARLRDLSADVGRRLRRGGWSARTVTLRLRYADFETITRQQTLDSGGLSDQVIGGTAMRLLRESWSGAPVRLLGVGVSGIEDAAQLDLFSTATERQRRVDRALDSLRSRFGDSSVRRGTAVTRLRDLDFRGEDLRRDGEQGQP
jgi:DNA polymerase-4